MNNQDGSNPSRRLDKPTLLKPTKTGKVTDSTYSFAICETGNIILVEQYRHGAKRILFELPGGNVASKEEPEAAERKLLEETG